jgi:hypothetical protein
VSGPHGRDENAWAEAIEATITTIKQQIPTARQIILPAVVGGPGGKPCPAPAGGRKARPGSKADGVVRTSAQLPDSVNAIRAVVKKHADGAVERVAGFESRVRACEDYAGALGHLTPAAAAVARAMGEHRARSEREPARAADGSAAAVARLKLLTAEFIAQHTKTTRGKAAP